MATFREVNRGFLHGMEPTLAADWLGHPATVSFRDQIASARKKLDAEILQRIYSGEFSAETFKLCAGIGQSYDQIDSLFAEAERVAATPKDVDHA